MQAFTRKLLVLCMSIAASVSTRAQDASRVYVDPNGWSIGTNVGMTDLWGDVGTKSPLDHYVNSYYYKNMKFMGGMFGRYTVHPAFAVRFQLNFGTVYANDNWNYDKAILAITEGEDPVQRYLRSQTAKSYVFEAASLFEFMPFRVNPEKGIAYRRGQPYLGMGIGLFHFTPYSTVNKSDKWVPTYDLHLEGQGWGEGYPDDYSMWQFCVPFVIGYRWDLGQHLNLGIEYQYRMTFTDYLDGVSGAYVDPALFLEKLSAKDASIARQVADKESYFNNSLPNPAGNLRGNADNKDGYSSLSITFFYKVPTRNRQWWHL
jgi:hypothetical protein